MMEKHIFFAQPIVDINTGKTLKNELLLRVSHQDDWHLPDHFNISLDLQSKLMNEALQKLDVKNIDLNLTGPQFADEGFLAGLTLFKQNNDILESLTIELTVAPDLDTLKAVGQQYRKVGIRLVIDDVGSDNRLSEVIDLLPYVDGIKFAIQNLRATGDVQAMAIRIQHWKKLADQHQLTFTLEGIETAHDIALAKKLGIILGQGYHYGKPQQPGANVC
ncbi:diguanylate cyclase phosphodiesterase domain-containing protein [Loigolactobacillus bifermentans DSM 20003]|uniref:Diguanylate cyclase phosphodiesterase domain-containing protein n=2 Tax=Loigolactobacillus bifermentans TaxID=1607 RepID=A0A0R1H0C1_9LACO|nr:EAL domain-containing protein [Loigolactobacillus bifermentans]KRK39902.1 diguanylate cyclase phosphodiesterase domain-containing protein [Loigolactobacillus bifermentans DSM 20003]QGG60435.1 EAL domain-containing protein [Loigolactobacillus bifermentans]